jgi:hypothetical protein
MDKLEPGTFVDAEGQFIEENGVRRFQVDAWTVTTQNQLYLSGTIQQQAGVNGLWSEGKFYPLADLPSDLPVPSLNVAVTGMAQGEGLDWQRIVIFDTLGGGGGGGGGGFARLNLSGPAVPWPTAAPLSTSEPAAAQTTGQRVEGEQGLLIVNIFEQPGGSRRTEYVLSMQNQAYILQGDLQALDANHNRPLKIWGTVTGYNAFHVPLLSVDRYEIPYPDLEFNILIGKQELSTREDKPAMLLHAEDGKTYVMTGLFGDVAGSEMQVGNFGDRVSVEGLLVPCELFSGLPVLRTFGMSMVTEGQAVDMTSYASQPNVSMEQTGNVNAEPPTVTIDSIQLVYYTANPRYAANYPEAMTPYLQPVWLFSGRVSNGNIIEIYVQALQQQFLLPEAAPGVQGG